MVGIPDWSTTAGSNATADSNINWSEGQLAPTVNNSARAMMAAIKAFQLGIGGAITYGGSSNAYTATNNAAGAWASYAAGNILALKANHTNTGAATINVDGLGAKSITTADGGALVAGDIVSGGIYLLAYDGTNMQVMNTLAGGAYQPLDATLTALAGLTTAADKLVYATGSDTFSTTDFTSFARTLLDDADAASARTTLGISASGATLQVANNLSDVASVSTSRTNLGLGTAATQNTGTSGANVPLLNGANTWSARQDIGSGIASGAICFSLQNSTVTNNSLAFYFQGSGTAGTFLPIDGGVNSTGDEFGYDFTNNYWFFDVAPRVSGSPMVTTTSTDTLTNKTLSSPTISGTVAGSPTATGAWTFSGSLITILRSGTAPAAAGDESLRVISTGGTNFNTAIGIVSGNAAEARILFGDSDDVDIGFITYLHTNNSLIIGTNNANAAIFSNAGALSVTGSITSAGAAVPTISSTDTLSNKTLSSPTISGTVAGSPTMTGTWTFPEGGLRIKKPASGSTLAGDVVFDISGDVLRIYESASPFKGFNINIAAMASQSQAATLANVETLTNKTLSSPTLSGTVAGTPTYSGNATYSSANIIMNGANIFGSSTGSAYTIGAEPAGSFSNGGFLQLYGSTHASTATAVLAANSSRQLVITNSAFTFAGVAVPTISSTDTLSNKTLSSPTISGTVAGTPTFSGATTFSATGAAVTINNAEPRMDFYQTDAGTDAKRWAFIADGNNFYLQTRTDADAFGANVISIVRSGTTGSSVSVTASSLNFTGVSTFQQTTDTIVTSQGGAGYGAFYSRGSGTNSSYVFFGNSTNNERSRILVDNSRNFIISNNDGSTNHFQVGPTGALTASGVAIPTVSSTDTLSNKTLTSPTINGGTIQSRVQTSSETSGTLTSASANKHLALTGNITLNNSVFTADDKMTLDPGTSARTITRGAGCTMYVNGVDSATATLAANQMGGVHVRSASVFVLTGAVS